MSFFGIKNRSVSGGGSGRVGCTTLLGIDCSASDSDIPLSRADGHSTFTGDSLPGTLNMIRSALGQVSKRAGYRPFENSLGLDTIDRVFTLGERCYIVSGSTVTVTDTDMNFVNEFTLPEDFSDCLAVQYCNHVYFLNGRCLYIYSIEKERAMYITSDGGISLEYPDDVYLPTLFIGCTPDGNGQAYEPVNLLNPYVAEQFIADGKSYEYTLNLEPDTEVMAYSKNERGDFVAIDPPEIDGRVLRFKSAPPLSNVEGEDNLRVVYKRKGYRDAFKFIAGCTCAELFGVAGYKDRLFVSGNDGCMGRVYYSELNSPLYFPDLNYIKVGGDGTKVCALAGRDVYLSVICNDNVYSVRGGTDAFDGDFLADAMFVITGIHATPLPLSSETAVFDNETLYITDDGICAITASGVMDERCAQIRSELVNKYLVPCLNDCLMLPVGDFLAVSDKTDRLYLFDGKQFYKNSNRPFSARQYECYVWSGIPAKCMWMLGGRLMFSDGRQIYCFEKGFESNNEYHDERVRGELIPINAYWETPHIYCTDFDENKFFTKLGVLLKGTQAKDGAPLNTGIRVLAKFDNGDWRVIRDYDGSHCVFRYGNISYARFVYWNTPKSYPVYKRLFHKKGRSIKLRFENTNLDEPFTLQGFKIDYLKM